MADSMEILNTLRDTITVVLHSPTRAIPLEYLGLLGVVLGALISILGNVFLSRRQARIQIRQDFFSRRFQVYLKIVELLWRGDSFTKSGTAQPSDKVHPNAYDSYTHLTSWVNTIVEYISSNRLLIDRTTLERLSNLNAKILDDLSTISQSPVGADLDERTRSVGRHSLEAIRDLCDQIDESARIYLKSTYKVDL